MVVWVFMWRVVVCIWMGGWVDEHMHTCACTHLKKKKKSQPTKKRPSHTHPPLNPTPPKILPQKPNTNKTKQGEPTDAALLADEAAARAFYKDLWADDDAFLKSAAEVIIYLFVCFAGTHWDGWMDENVSVYVCV